MRTAGTRTARTRTARAKRVGATVLVGFGLLQVVRVAWGQSAVAGAASAGGYSVLNKPLPDAEVLRQRALVNYAKTSEARERYLCRELITTHELDSRGAVKKTERLERESFYVHGHQINQDVAKDGKPLSEGEQRKQAETVRKQIAEAMRPGSKRSDQDGSFKAGDFLKMAKLTNGRRVLVSGRPTIVFDAAGNPDGRAGSIAGRFMQAMVGTVSIDEQTGTPQDINMRGIKDVKVGGGMVANVHKGFYVHVLIAPQPDGVWLLNRAYGAGDARVGLFLHPSARFEQQMEGCKLSNVTADSVEKMKGEKR